jgi:hypothetical protein
VRRLGGRRIPGMWLLDLNVAGASADADGGATAVDGAAYVMTVQTPLHRDGLGDVDAAGAGVCVEIEVGVADDQTDGSAPCGELPVCGGLALRFDVAAAGAGLEGASDALKTDAAAAGFCFNVAGADLLKFDITRAGA